MQTVSITSRITRIWSIAGGIGALSAAILVLLVMGKWLLLNNRPDVLDWIVLASPPFCLALGWLLYIQFTNGRRARRLIADQRGVTIVRVDGRTIDLAWNDIQAIEYNSLEEEILAFRTSDARVAVLGHAFSSDDWAQWVGTILERVADQVEFYDTQRDFDRRLTTWLNRTSIGFVVVGGGATVALAAWNPNNAAAWIIFVGTLAVLVYLGSQTDHDQDEIPIATVIGFWSAKMFAIIPIALIVVLLVQPIGIKLPAQKHAGVFYACNAMFFGGMAAALLVRGGFSPTQYFRRDLRGLNRFHRGMFIAALGICAIGFVLKSWNEN